MSKELMHIYPQSVNSYQLIKFLPHWLICLDLNRSPLSDQIPWITFSAIDFLKKYLKKNMTVFEYGSGGSTIFFSRYVKEIISTEHDPDWYRKVLKEIEKCGITNWKGYLVEPEKTVTTLGDFSNPLSYTSKDNINLSFKNYVLTIEQYPDEYFDLVLIDGRARPSCLYHCLNKVKRGGCIMLDNSDREYYLQQTYSFVKNFKLIDFPGPTPYAEFFTKTSVWQKTSQVL